MLITNANGRLATALNQAIDGSRELVIATAYISPGACEQILLMARSRRCLVKVSVGRAYADGLAPTTKNYLLRLNEAASTLGGGVRVAPSGFHSKLYCTDRKSFIGSSNLTEHGISDWTEANYALEGLAAEQVKAEAIRLFDGSVQLDAVSDEIPTLVIQRKPVLRTQDSLLELPTEPEHPALGIAISLLDRSGQVPAFSGLNWGLARGRPRDRYECYIRFPKAVHEMGRYVFGSQEKGSHFIARTHDGKVFRMRLEGASKRGDVEAKQISTAGDKSALGRWMIRDCLRISDGRAVTLEDLLAYGTSYVEFYRVGTEPDGTPVVYLNFSRT